MVGLTLILIAVVLHAAVAAVSALIRGLKQLRARRQEPRWYPRDHRPTGVS
jgi:hypothetical protein